MSCYIYINLKLHARFVEKKRFITDYYNYALTKKRETRRKKKY